MIERPSVGDSSNSPNHVTPWANHVTLWANIVWCQSSVTITIAPSVPAVVVSMARSAVLSFDDPISYQTAIRPAAVEVFVAAKGSMRVQLAQI